MIEQSRERDSSSSSYPPFPPSPPLPLLPPPKSSSNCLHPDSCQCPLWAFIEEDNILLSLVNQKWISNWLEVPILLQRCEKIQNCIWGRRNYPLFSLGVNSLRLFLLFLASSPPPLLNPRTFPRELSTTLTVERLEEEQKVRERPRAATWTKVGSCFLFIFIF